MHTPTSLPSRHILLVDDDSAVRESIKLLLSIDQHKVTEASDGHQALSLFRGSGFDLVITDYLMPEMLGDELVRNIRRIKPEQPVLMLTAFLEKLAAGGMPAGGLLAKPVALEDLREAILRQIEPGTTSHSSASLGLSRSALLHRAAAGTQVLGEMLRAKPHKQVSPDHLGTSGSAETRTNAVIGTTIVLPPKPLRSSLLK